MLVPATSRDAWVEFQDCGSEAPCRTEEQLKAMISALGLTYGEGAERWGAAFQAMYDTGWAWDLAVPDEAVIAALVLCPECGKRMDYRVEPDEKPDGRLRGYGMFICPACLHDEDAEAVRRRLRKPE